MGSCKALFEALRVGKHDQALSALYALDGSRASLDKARDRACHAVQSLMDAFSPGEDAPAALFSGPGRTELGGNHTDHQHGRVLCGSVDMDMLACAVPNGKDVIRIRSEGYPALEIGLDGQGAIRVHGGGFAGTIQAFVPLEMVDRFKAEMERVLGGGKCHVLHIRPQGGCVVAE